MEEAVDQAGRWHRWGSTSLDCHQRHWWLKPPNYQSFYAERQFIHQILGSVVLRNAWKTPKVMKIILTRWVCTLLSLISLYCIWLIPYVDPSRTLKLPSYYLWPGTSKIGKCANSGMAYLFYPHEISDVFAFDTIFSWLQSNLQLKVLLMSHEPYRYYAWLIQARWAMDSRQK